MSYFSLLPSVLWQGAWTLGTGHMCSQPHYMDDGVLAELSTESGLISISRVVHASEPEKGTCAPFLSFTAYIAISPAY